MYPAKRRCTKTAAATQTCTCTMKRVIIIIIVKIVSINQMGNRFLMWGCASLFWRLDARSHVNLTHIPCEHSRTLVPARSHPNLVSSALLTFYTAQRVRAMRCSTAAEKLRLMFIFSLFLLFRVFLFLF